MEVCGVIPNGTVEVFLNDELEAPVARASGSGCVFFALGGKIVFSLGDTVLARQFTADGNEAWSEERVVSTDGVPEYDPDYWNGEQHITRNGCYDYAVDKRNDLNAVPGVAGGAITPSDPQQYTCAALDAAVQADGLVPVAEEENCDGCTHKVALYLSPWVPPASIEPYFVRVGHHFYRENPDDTWSHKYGTTQATNRDRDGVVITNPQEANRDYSDLPDGYIEDYHELCGFYCVDKKKVHPLGLGSIY